MRLTKGLIWKLLEVLRGRKSHYRQVPPCQVQQCSKVVTICQLPALPPINNATIPIHLMSTCSYLGLQLLVKEVPARMRLEDVPKHPWIRANADPKALGN